jgi:putative SOS response-associated peptidase YedK
MCGRFSITAQQDVLEKFFGATFKDEFKPRYNVAPTQKAPIIMNSAPDEIHMVRWGLIPSWAKDEKIGYKLINARKEGIQEKPSFRSSFKSKRCLVLTDGFYEWKKSGSNKIPYRIVEKSGEPFALAGLYDEWNGKKTFTIITVPPSKVMKGIHDRMPAIIKKEDRNSWLVSDNLEKVHELLQSYEELRAYPVSNLVNSPRNDVPEVVKELRTLI